MANYSIPNSTPAIGRISTPLSRRSRKQNNSVARRGPSNLAAITESGASSPINPQRSIQTVGHWMLDVERWAFSFCWRVKGAWWSSRSSKPLSVPHTRNRGRFDSYPLRQIFLAASLCRGAFRIRQDTATQRRRYSSSWKGGDRHVA